MNLKRVFFLLAFFMLSFSFLFSQRIYFSQSTPPNFYRCNLDGSNLENFEIQAGGFDVDSNDGTIYYTSGLRIYKATFGDFNSIETLVSNLTNPISLALDEVNQKIYWIDNGSSFYISRCNTDGTEVELLYDGLFGSYHPNMDLALDLQNEKIYVTNAFLPNEIFSLNFDGTNKEEISELADLYDLYSVNIVPSEQKIYLGAYISAIGSSENKIHRMNFDGTNKEEIFSFEQLEFKSIDDTSIDTINNIIYVLNDYEDKIQTMNLDGTNFQDAFQISPTSSGRFERILIAYDDITTNVKSLLTKNYETQISPNPSNGFLSIVLKNKADKLIISNQLGIEVFRNSLSISHSKNIDISNLSNGIYFVNIFLNNGTIETHKVILNN